MIHKMTTSTNSNNKNFCVQLTRYVCCLILLLAALPFITLAAIFSFFVDIPHIKIDLGNDNVVESVYFKLHKSTVEESDEEDDDDDEELIELSKKLSRLVFGENTNIITTESILWKKVDTLLGTVDSEDCPNPVPHHAELWALLGADDDDALTWAELTEKLRDHYHVLGEDDEDETDSGNEADDEDENTAPASPARKLTGRTGGFAEDDEPPVTPIRKVSEPECPGAPRRPSAVEVDTGIITNRVRSTTDLNDSDSTQDHASSCEKASENAPQPSESLPAS